MSRKLRINAMKNEINWIPVSEGYPDSPRQVLVTYRFVYEEETENGGTDKEYQYEIGIGEYWGEGKGVNDICPPEERGFGRYHKYVTAWAELPEPYTNEIAKKDFENKIKKIFEVNEERENGIKIL